MSVVELAEIEWHSGLGSLVVEDGGILSIDDSQASSGTPSPLLMIACITIRDVFLIIGPIKIGGCVNISGTISLKQSIPAGPSAQRIQVPVFSLNSSSPCLDYSKTTVLVSSDTGCATAPQLQVHESVLMVVYDLGRLDNIECTPPTSSSSRLSPWSLLGSWNF